MRAADFDLIFVPDLGTLAADHWLNRWREKLSTARLVATGPMADRAGEAAIEAVAEAAAKAARPVLFIAYAAGAIAVVHAAQRLSGADVRGAFLVAPPSDAALGTLVHTPWPATPRKALPWPSLVIASRTDPLAPFEHSRALAADWGAQFVDAGEAGRIDALSGHGPWPDGLLRLAGFMRGL